MTETKRREWHAQTAYTRMVSARLPIELADRLKAYCDQHGATMTDVVQLAVSQYLDDADAQDELSRGGSRFLIL